jgi:hypothetical protein
VNDNDAGDTANTGEAGFTVSVTATVFGDPVAPGAVTVTVPVYVPAASPAVFTDTDRAPAPVPLAGDTDNQV